MVLIKSKPNAIFNDRFVPQSFNQMMQAFFDDSKVQSNSVDFFPKADVIEKNKQYEIHLALPGLKKEDIKISVEGDMLNIEGERRHSLSEETDKIVRRETSYGKFSRSFNVSKLDTSSVEASFENGILSITIPKQSIEKQSVIQIK